MRRYCLCPLPWSAASSLYSPRQLNNQLNALQISNSFLLRSRSQRWVNIEKVETKKNHSSSQLYHYKQKIFWMLIAICFWLYCMDLSHHNESNVLYFILSALFFSRLVPDRLQCHLVLSQSAPEPCSMFRVCQWKWTGELLKCKIWLLPSQCQSLWLLDIPCMCCNCQQQIVSFLSSLDCLQPGMGTGTSQRWQGALSSEYYLSIILCQIVSL